jgi:hypothetical protein
MGGCILPNASYPLQPSTLPQAVSQMENQEPFMQQPFPPLHQSPSQLAQMPLQQTSSQSSQLEVSEVQRQFHQTEKVEQQLSSQVPQNDK